MSSSTPQQDATMQDTIVRGAYAARRIADALAWGEGGIVPQADHVGPTEEQSLVEAVLDNLDPVADQETAYSSCTDGRLPVRLLDDVSVPVREQMVGADMVSAFYVAEALGAHFYKDPHAPVANRVREVAQFLYDNKLLPSSHVGCGAAAGFVTITANAIRFSKNPAYIARLQTLLPADLYDADLHEAMHTAAQKRLDVDTYKELSAQTFLDAVEAISGKHAIAELKDDGRGVHGHTEEAVVRVRVPGKAVNTAKLAEVTGGREVFGVNDLRMDRIARLFARGQDQDYAIARIALEDFASSGHGTLAKDLPTYIVTSA